VASSGRRDVPQNREEPQFPTPLTEKIGSQFLGMRGVGVIGGTCQWIRGHGTRRRKSEKGEQDERFGGG